MVALVKTHNLLAGIGQIFLSSKKSFVIQNSLGRIQENGRYAMDVVISDLRRASYWGGNADISTITGTQGVNLAAAEACTDTSSGPSDWSRMLGRGVYGMDLSGSEKPSDTGNDYSCIKDAGATPYVRGDVFLVRYAHPSAIGSITKPLPCNQSAPNSTISDCYPNEYFLRSSLFRGRLFQGINSEDSDNDLVAPAIRTAELVARAYYVGTSNNASACPADGAVPSLFRVSLVNGVFSAGEVASGVDNLQIKALSTVTTTATQLIQPTLQSPTGKALSPHVSGCWSAPNARKPASPTTTLMSWATRAIPRQTLPAAVTAASSIPQQ
jgi:type IV pilus assembly protein PilW